MPNWVFNSLQVSGRKESVEALRDILAMPRPYQKYVDGKPYDCVEGEWVMEDVEHISFWNIVCPPPNKWSQYFGTKGWKNDELLGDGEWNWYNWNVNTWGCKWDASDTSMETYTLDDMMSISYNFQTPWSPPMGFYTELAIYCHAKGIAVSIEWEEEQGFGARHELDDEGNLITEEEWDIPESHQDYINQGKGDSCMCMWADESDWFSDCPRETVNA